MKQTCLTSEVFYLFFSIALKIQRFSSVKMVQLFRERVDNILFNIKISTQSDLMLQRTNLDFI